MVTGYGRAMVRLRHHGRASLCLALIALAMPAAAQTEPAGADIYIGTLERDGHAIVLRRCDLVENRYLLEDAPGGQALAAMRKVSLPAYGEVVARYVERDGQSILLVESIERLTPGKDCHLGRALEDIGRGEDAR
ncbi:hypothetical protein ACUXPF_001472 [Sphingomonas sanguinis]|jgi:hypothetical protein